MKAIVCDKCGKVVLLEDQKPYFHSPEGIYMLSNDRDGYILEMCEDCANELLERVRKTKEEAYG